MQGKIDDKIDSKAKICKQKDNGEDIEKEVENGNFCQN
jgi:hypothetical protein